MRERKRNLWDRDRKRERKVFETERYYQKCDREKQSGGALEGGRKKERERARERDRDNQLERVTDMLVDKYHITRVPSRILTPRPLPAASVASATSKFT